MKIKIFTVLALLLLTGCAGRLSDGEQEIFNYAASGRMSMSGPMGEMEYSVEVFGQYPQRVRLDVKAPFIGTVAMLVLDGDGGFALDYSRRAIIPIEDGMPFEIFDIPLGTRDAIDFLSLQMAEEDLGGGCIYEHGNAMAHSICCDDMCIFLEYSSFDRDKQREDSFFLPPAGLDCDTMYIN